MSLGARLRSCLGAALHRSRIESDMDRELRFHIESYADDLVRGGLSAQEARRRARMEFGALEARKEECREALGLRLLDELAADVRYAFRVLRQAPAFTAVAVLSLALGLGANTAIFSLMQAALWQPVPVDKPEQLRLLSWTDGPASVDRSTWGDKTTTLSYPVLRQLQRENSVFQSMFTFKSIGRITAVIDGHAEMVAGELVSGNFYESLGVSTIAGRPISAGDDARRGDGVVAVISDGFWARRFSRDPSVVGKRIILNKVPVTIIGVNSPVFTGMEPGLHPDVFVPLGLQPVLVPNPLVKDGALLDDPAFWWLPVMGRLKPGVTESQAQAALGLLFEHAVRASLPGQQDRSMPRLRLVSGARGLDEAGLGGLGNSLLVLFCLTGLVLLIACVNVANLLLARAVARRREIGMRLALGAGRWRITRQMLTEGLVLASLGGAAGLLLGYWMRNGIPSLLGAPWNPSPLRAEFGYPVVAISIAMTLLTGVLFSLAPAWQSTRVEVNAALKDGGRSISLRLPKLLAGKSLVVLQICLSLVLLVGAGLFLRTLSNLKSASLGFQPERVLLFTVDPPVTEYPIERRRALFAQLEERIGTIPGVQSGSLSWEALIARGGVSLNSVHPTGRPPRPGDADDALFNIVGGRFFETMGIPILYGRSIGPQDRANSLRVAVVNQQFVKNFFPNENPLGKTFENQGGTTWQIVGVCGDARYNQVRGSFEPTFYHAFTQAQSLRGAMTFEVKTAASQVGIMRAVREVLRDIDRDLPVFDVRTQTEQIDATLLSERMFATLTSGFGLLVLVLASVGIYGSMAYAVARRTSEIGLRMALGARTRQVLVMVLRETALLAGIGVAIGLLAAAGLTRYVRSMLYGLEPSDPLTFCGAALFMLFVALLAGWRPARRASRLDPMAALRHD